MKGNREGKVVWGKAGISEEQYRPDVWWRTPLTFIEHLLWATAKKPRLERVLGCEHKQGQNGVEGSATHG